LPRVRAQVLLETYIRRNEDLSALDS
jgi:hypothetical protein